MAKVRERADDVERATGASGGSSKGKSSRGKDPKGKSPKGKDPKGKSPKGKSPKGKDPKGKDPKGKDPKGKDPKGKDPKGKSPKGKSPKGKGPGGRGSGEASKDAGTYTAPDLRRSLKERIQREDRGGRPGQWSARKAQLLVQEYEKRGGGYTSGGKDATQQHLSAWTDEGWRTRDGQDRARTDDGEVRRYLPADAWDELSPREAEETDAAKRRASRRGRQHVPNTPRAAAAGSRARGRDYSAMTVAQVLESLDGARRSTVQRALDEERRGKGRVTLVRQLEQRLR